VADPVARKELQLRMTFVADAANATQAMRAIADQAARTEQAVGRAGSALRSLGGYQRPGAAPAAGPFDGFAAGGSGGSGGDTAKRAAQLREERLQQNLTALRNLNLGGPVGRFEQVRSFGQAASELGIPGGAAISRAALPLALAAGAFQTASAAGATLNDSFLTGDQTNRALVRDFVPFGETIQTGVDNISGRKDALARNTLAAQQEAARRAGRLDVAQTQLSLAPQQAGAVARARLLGGAAPVLEGYTDRSTAGGEAAFREKQRLLPLERESAKAEREAAVAAAQRAAAGTELAKAETRMADLRRERARLDRELAGAGSGPERQRLLLAIGNNENEGLRRSAASGLADARRGEAQARYAAGAVGVARLGAEAQGLEEDAASAAGTAARLGGQNRFQRANARSAFERLKQFGPELLSETELAQAQSYAPQEAAKILQKFGEGTDEFKAGVADKLVGFEGAPEELRRRAAEKRDEAARGQLDLDKALADATAAAGRDLAQQIGKVIRDVVESTVKELKNQVLLGKV
jgi:hypothetical protein